MPRSRAVMPDHFTGTRGQVSADAWKLLQAAECYGDDAGLHPVDPAQLRAEAFPHHVTVTTDITRALIVELVDAGLLVPYLGPDKRLYVFSRMFHEDQRPQNPSQAKHPLPPFVSEEHEDKPGRVVYRYKVDAVALVDYLEGSAGKAAVRELYRTCRRQLGLDELDTSGTCTEQRGSRAVRYMYDVVKRSEEKKREEKDLERPSSTVQRTPTPPGRSESSPVASDLVSNQPTESTQTCLTVPDSLFAQAVAGLEAHGFPLTPMVRVKLLAALEQFCDRHCPVRSLSHDDRIARVLPVCREMVDNAVAILRDQPDRVTERDLPTRYTEALLSARQGLLDEIIAVALGDKAISALGVS